MCVCVCVCVCVFVCVCMCAHVHVSALCIYPLLHMILIPFDVCHRTVFLCIAHPGIALHPWLEPTSTDRKISVLPYCTYSSEVVRRQEHRMSFYKEQWLLERHSFCEYIFPSAHISPTGYTVGYSHTNHLFVSL